MIDIFLTVLAAIVFVLIWIACVYLLAYFQHPSDNRTAYFPKVVAVIGAALAASNVMMLPLDVAQRSSPFDPMPMDFLWLFLYVMIAVFGILVIPFAIFYIEAEDEKGSSQGGKAVVNTLILLAIFAVLFVVGYIFLGFSRIPMKNLTTQLIPASTPLLTIDCSNGTVCASDSEDLIWTVKLSPVIFLITVISAVGWLLFIIFGGIGLIALPFDLVRSYLHRPKPINKATYEDRKIKLGEEAELLIKEGMELMGKSKKAKGTRKERNEWKTKSYMLDREYVHNEIAYKKKGGPAIFYWIKLALGILAGVGTLLWILQGILWTNLKFYPFLNFMLVAMDGIWQFFGTVFFGLFAFYLLLAVVKGNFKWGIRVPGFMTLHPMKVNGTMQNSILVNVVLILITSVAISQYLADSFSTYARRTAINSIFNIAIKNLRGISIYWLVVYWALPCIALLTIIFFIVKPNDAHRKLVNEAQKTKGKIITKVAKAAV